MRSRRYQSCQQSSFLSYTLRRHWRYVFGHILRLLFEAPECYQVTNHFVTLYRRIYYVWLISSSSISCRCTLVQYQREASELPTIFKCWILRWIAKKKQRWRLIEFSSSIFVHRAIFYRLVFPIFQGTNCPCVLFCSLSRSLSLSLPPLLPFDREACWMHLRFFYSRREGEYPAKKSPRREIESCGRFV